MCSRAVHENGGAGPDLHAPRGIHGLAGTSHGVAAQLGRGGVGTAIGRIVRRAVARPSGFHEPVDHDRAALEVNQVGTRIEASAAHHAVVTDDQGAPGLDRDRAAAGLLVRAGARQAADRLHEATDVHRATRARRDLYEATRTGIRANDRQGLESDVAARQRHRDGGARIAPDDVPVEEGVRVHDEVAGRDADRDPGRADFHLPPVGEVQGLGDGERTRLHARDDVRDLAFESDVDESAEGHAIVSRRIAHGAERRDERHERQHCHRPGADRPPGTIREESKDLAQLEPLIRLCFAGTAVGLDEPDSM